MEAGIPWFLLSVSSDVVEHRGGIGGFFIESAKIICFVITQLLLNFRSLFIRKMFERCAWYDGYFMIEISIVLILVVYKLFHWYLIMIYIFDWITVLAVFSFIRKELFLYWISSSLFLGVSSNRDLQWYIILQLSRWRTMFLHWELLLIHFCFYLSVSQPHRSHQILNLWVIIFQ